MRAAGGARSCSGCPAPGAAAVGAVSTRGRGSSSGSRRLGSCRVGLMGLGMWHESGCHWPGAPSAGDPDGDLCPMVVGGPQGTSVCNVCPGSPHKSGRAIPAPRSGDDLQPLGWPLAYDSEPRPVADYQVTNLVPRGANSLGPPLHGTQKQTVHAVAQCLHVPAAS